MPDRLSTLRDLVALARPIAELTTELKTYPWDSDEELVTLAPTRVEDVLGRYLRRELSTAEVEAWADALEGRDDIAFQPRDVIDVIFELATPDLHGELTTQRANELRERVHKLGSTSNGS